MIFTNFLVLLLTLFLRFSSFNAEGKLNIYLEIYEFKSQFQINSDSSTYSSLQANTSLWLSAAAYCGSSSYKSHTFAGPTDGFVVTSIIEDLPSDTEGIVHIFCFLT